MNPTKFSKKENLLLEADMFVRVCRELIEYFRLHYKEYFRHWELLVIQIHMKILCMS